MVASPTTDPARLTDLRASARGWQGIQVAVLGFIGLCGVLTQQDKSTPHGLQVLAGVVALAALALACLGMFLVGRTAWPLYRAGRAPEDGPAAVDAAGRSLSRGLAVTFAAVALTALSALSGWWPTAGGGGGGAPLLQAQADGQTVCGTLAPAPSGAIHLRTAQGTIEIPAQALTALKAVSAC
jgi:hypothetical protein